MACLRTLSTPSPRHAFDRHWKHTFNWNWYFLKAVHFARNMHHCRHRQPSALKHLWRADWRPHARRSLWYGAHATRAHETARERADLPQCAPAHIHNRQPPTLRAHPTDAQTETLCTYATPFRPQLVCSTKRMQSVCSLDNAERGATCTFWVYFK